MSISSPPIWTAVDQRARHGPFDVIGDVHGCAIELDDLFAVLGYEPRHGVWTSPAGRTPIFVGDLVDRGPDSAGVLRRVMAMVSAGRALAVPGNHDVQLQRYLEGESVPIAHGLDTTVAELDRESADFQREVLAFLQRLPSHYVTDNGRLVVAHTGLPEDLQGRASPDVRHLAAYGVPPGEPDLGDPEMRHGWVATYRGTATVVYGHTPHIALEWRHNSIDIDTGCVFGVRLTALRWPERALVSVAARRAYAAPTRHFPG